MQARQVKHLIRTSAIAAGVLAATIFGLVCLRYSFADPLVRLSYDLPFLWRTTLDTHEIALIYLDEYSAKQLNQPRCLESRVARSAPGSADSITQENHAKVMVKVCSF